MIDVTNHSGVDSSAFVESLASDGEYRPNPVERIAKALEAIAFTLATLLPGDEEPAEEAPVTIMTQDGPVTLTR